MKTTPTVALCIAGLLGLCGCAPRYSWVRDATTQQQFERDRAQCLYESKAATASYSSGPTPRTLGGSFGQGFADGITLAMRENELAVLCMKARGYSQRAIDAGETAPQPAVATAPANPTPAITPARPAVAQAASDEPEPRPSYLPIVPDRYAAGMRSDNQQGSRWSYTAESVAKQSGCAQPTARLNYSAPGVETFTVSCGGNEPMSVRCDMGTCRAMK